MNIRHNNNIVVDFSTTIFYNLRWKFYRIKVNLTVGLGGIMNQKRKNEGSKTRNRYSSDNRPYKRNTRDDIYNDGFSNKSNYVDIYSSGRRKNTKISIKKVVLSIFFVILGIIGAAMIYAYNMLHSFNYQEFEDDT